MFWFCCHVRSSSYLVGLVLGLLTIALEEQCVDQVIEIGLTLGGGVKIQLILRVRFTEFRFGSLICKSCSTFAD